MPGFIKFAELRPNLERKDWTGFAKRYNGPRYAQNHYDKKLEEALSEIYEVEKRYALMSIDFCFGPRFYAMPGIKPGIFR